ncbi:hypothetical protein IPJ70_02785 [Candidatus Campbellbacteria bacterium]|nr:MAG: hypothetical protein IPJ70_02785 [Candidatus Campbellbacteria bacterium]
MEGPPKNEKVEKKKVLEMLRDRGPQDSETMEAVFQWTQQQEALAVQDGTSRGHILFEIERADLYVAISDIEGALECLDDARLQAQQENFLDLYDQIVRKMNEIEAS